MPKAACPLRTAAATLSTGRSSISTLTCGKRFLKLARRYGTSVDASRGEVATAKRCARRSTKPRRPSNVLSRFSNTRSIEGNNSWPASVSAILRVVRSNRRTASSPSSALINMDRAEGVRYRRCAARVMLPSWATATNARSCRMVTADCGKDGMRMITLLAFAIRQKSVRIDHSSGKWRCSVTCWSQPTPAEPPVPALNPISRWTDTKCLQRYWLIWSPTATRASASR